MIISGELTNRGEFELTWDLSILTHPLKMEQGISPAFEALPVQLASAPD